MNLVLIGLRGSGKTTIGRMVAERLRRPFIDLDDETARALGAPTVGEAFTKHDEAAFRKAEAGAIARVLRTDGLVIALGGGTPTAPGAADLLRRERDAGSVFIAYLAADAVTLRRRLAGTDISSRPSLTGADPLAEIEAVLAKRDTLFRELADEVMDTDGASVEEIARRLVDRTAEAPG